MPLHQGLDEVPSAIEGRVLAVECDEERECAGMTVE